MRIRKRFPPSSISSSAVPSDPQPNRSAVVQANIQANPHENLHILEEAKIIHPRKPDPKIQTFEQATSQEMMMMIRSANPRWGFCSKSTEEKLKQKQIEVKEIKDERFWKEEEKSSNDTRKESIEGELSMQFPQPSSPSSPVERWCERDKVVPLKKRKRSFESIANKETTKPKMKSKTNKKCLIQNGDHHGLEGITETDDQAAINGKNSTSNAKKSKRGSVIMEGSRCSRVNGRGWRCCQQTLVGYSLCEHHLGKGRLRSMTSVRNQAMANQIGAKEKDEIAPLSSSIGKQEGLKSLSSKKVDVDEDDKKKPLTVVTKKRMKLGAVKARSISSLLGQTNNNALMAANGNKSSG